MSEKDLSRLLMNSMKAYGDFQRIENMVGVGMPDVSYCIRGTEGFIENKWRASWPRDPEDIVTLDHFTPQQRIWIKRRTSAGGRVYVFLQVGTGYYLLPGRSAALSLGKDWRRRDIERAALICGLGAFPTKNLLAVLSGTGVRSQDRWAPGDNEA